MTAFEKHAFGLEIRENLLNVFIALTLLRKRFALERANVSHMWFRRSKTSQAEMRENILASKPIRRAEAKRNGAQVMIPIAARRGLLFRIPEGATKTFELDPMGLFVWNRCDGQTTVQQIIEEFAENFGIDRERAEASTLQFLNLLAGRALVARKVESGY